MKPFVADVHMHSILSGHAFGTIRELAAEASRRGLSLIGVTEHAPGIPGTVDPIYFRNLCDAPRELYGVEMLYGSEVNVLKDVYKRQVQVGTIVGYSIPVFITSIVFIWLFAIILGWFPVSGMKTPGSDYTGMKKFLDELYYMALPLSLIHILSL